MSDVFEQWKGKQAAMGRRVPDTFAPYSPVSRRTAITLEPHAFHGTEQKCTHVHSDQMVCGLNRDEHE